MWFNLLEGIRWFWTVTMLVTACVLFFYFHLEVLAIMIVIREIIAVEILRVEREWEDVVRDGE